MNGLARLARTAGKPKSLPVLHPGASAATGERPAQPADEILGRLSRRRPRTVAGEVCELCGAPAGPDHPHVVDVQERGLLCACRACALLFQGTPTGRERFRTIGDEHVRLDPFVLPAGRWRALQIPVGTAFFMAHSGLGRTVAFYPSPGGATECELPLDAWEDVVTDNPRLASLREDVEAALVQVGSLAPSPRGQGTGAPTCYVVPVDRCYELVGELRLHWRGFDGGQEVRERLRAFTDDLERRAAER